MAWFDAILDNDSKNIIITRRDLFAAAAMCGLLANSQNNFIATELIASWSVECADKMIERLCSGNDSAPKYGDTKK